MVLFVDPHWGVGTVDVAGRLQEVLKGNHVDLLIAGDLGQLFLIEVSVNWDHADQGTRGRSGQDEGLIDVVLIDAGVVDGHRPDIAILVGRKFLLLVGNVVLVQDLFNLGLLQFAFLIFLAHLTLSPFIFISGTDQFLSRRYQFRQVLLYWKVKLIVKISLYGPRS